MSQRAKDSGLWSLSADKGAVNAGQEVPVDVTSTLNKPRGVGGLAVLSMAKPLIFRIRAGGSGDGRPELVCGCSCSTFYRLSSGLDQEEEEGRLVEAIFEDAAVLPVELLGAGGAIKLGSWPRPAPSALVTVTVTPSTY